MLRLLCGWMPYRELPQPREPRQNLQPAFCQLLSALHGYLLLQLLTFRLVETLLLPLQLRIHDLLQLVRKLTQHLLLSSAQDKRCRHPLQPFRCLRILLYNRKLIALPKMLISSEQPRHQIIKDTPQLT